MCEQASPFLRSARHRDTLARNAPCSERDQPQPGAAPSAGHGCTRDYGAPCLVLAEAVRGRHPRGAPAGNFPLPPPPSGPPLSTSPSRNEIVSEFRSERCSACLAIDGKEAFRAFAITGVVLLGLGRGTRGHRAAGHRAADREMRARGSRGWTADACKNDGRGLRTGHTYSAKRAAQLAPFSPHLPLPSPLPIPPTFPHLPALTPTCHHLSLPLLRTVTAPPRCQQSYAFQPEHMGIFYPLNTARLHFLVAARHYDDGSRDELYSMMAASTSPECTTRAVKVRKKGGGAG